MRKGIILAGGRATRLGPVTKHITKQLLPVYDKPMVYYPLTTLIEARVRDVLLICDPAEVTNYRTLLGDGSAFGIRISYATQGQPRGIAESLIIADDVKFIRPDDRIFLVLGDNLFHGSGMRDKLHRAGAQTEAQVFLCSVKDPQRYGVAAFVNNKLAAIVEKPTDPPSTWAVSGLYIYNYDCVDIAHNIKPSERQELEITAVNNAYLSRDCLTPNFLDRIAWLDMGTPDSLFEAAEYVRAIQQRSAYLVGCPEEAAYENGWLSEQFLRWAGDPRSAYGLYLQGLSERVTH